MNEKTIYTEEKITSIRRVKISARIQSLSRWRERMSNYWAIPIFIYLFTTLRALQNMINKN